MLLEKKANQSWWELGAQANEKSKHMEPKLSDRKLEKQGALGIGIIQQYREKKVLEVGIHSWHSVRFAYSTFLHISPFSKLSVVYLSLERE